MATFSVEVDVGRSYSSGPQHAIFLDPATQVNAGDIEVSSFTEADLVLAPGIVINSYSLTFDFSPASGGETRTDVVILDNDTPLTLYALLHTEASPVTSVSLADPPDSPTTGSLPVTVPEGVFTTLIPQFFSDTPPTVVSTGGLLVVDYSPIAGRKWWLGVAGWGGTSTCVLTAYASSSNNTYSPPRAAIELDAASIVNPCGLDVELEAGAVVAVLLIPPGVYSGATATIVWGDGASAECYLAVENSTSTTIVDDIDTGTSGIGLSVGAFTVPAPNGRVYIFADFTAAGGSHTIDPATVITITKTG